LEAEAVDSKILELEKKQASLPGALFLFVEKSEQLLSLVFSRI